MNVSVQRIEQLRSEVRARLSEKRFLHTLGVERAAIRLGRGLMPDMLGEITCAALLHDISKELPIQDQIAMLINANLIPDITSAPPDPVIHSYTAPLVIKRDFPDVATPNVLSAVKNHTVGAPDMSVFDAIIYIADFVEETRTYSACIEVRDALFSGFEAADAKERLNMLYWACLRATDHTIYTLQEKGKPIDPISFETKNSLAMKLLHQI